MKTGRCLREGCIDLVDGLRTCQAGVVLQAHRVHLHIPHAMQIESFQERPCSTYEFFQHLKSSRQVKLSFAGSCWMKDAGRDKGHCDL